jgi:hypothetical protein
MRYTEGKDIKVYVGPPKPISGNFILDVMKMIIYLIILKSPNLFIIILNN